ncbi:unnamed protein product [Lactuca saligna]|uniref:t-SNARE coiled-coil homology domain-containing protein n=1 Tax=Lactuca saligna TaxID=75948 RepID=A0AA35ZG82_LACSI|nr:unnamed protein product [Lactuca saligna]
MMSSYYPVFSPPTRGVIGYKGLMMNKENDDGVDSSELKAASMRMGKRWKNRYVCSALNEFHRSMASSSHKGSNYYGAASYRSREGLSTRPVTNSDEIQLRIDPVHADLDDHIGGLYKQVRQLKNVATEIELEAKNQNEFINQLQMTLIKAQAEVKNNMRKLNKSIIQSGANHTPLSKSIVLSLFPPLAFASLKSPSTPLTMASLLTLRTPILYLDLRFPCKVRTLFMRGSVITTTECEDGVKSRIASRSIKWS